MRVGGVGWCDFVMMFDRSEELLESEVEEFEGVLILMVLLDIVVEVGL